MTTKPNCGWPILFSMTQSNTLWSALVCYSSPPVIAGSLVGGGCLSEDASKDRTDDLGYTGGSGAGGLLSSVGTFSTAPVCYVAELQVYV